MAYYHIGTEDIHFKAIGVPAVWEIGGKPDDDRNGLFRSDWARCALNCNAGPYIDERWRAPLDHNPVSTDEFWWTCQLHQVGGAVIQNTSLIDFLSEDEIPRLRLDGQNGKLAKLYRQDTADSDFEDLILLATGTLPMPSAGRRGKIDIYVNLSTGEYRVYVDNILVLDFAGDLTGGLYDAVTHYEVKGSHSLVYVSELLWRSDDTRKLVGVKSIWPVADGFATDWIGTVPDVDDITCDNSDANYTDTVGLVQEYTTPPLPDTLTGNVVVGPVMLGIRMANNPTDVAIVVRTGGVDYLSPSYDTDGVIEDRMYIWENNPDTGVAFTQPQLDDPDFNIGVKST